MNYYEPFSDFVRTNYPHSVIFKSSLGLAQPLNWCKEHWGSRLESCEWQPHNTYTASWTNLATVFYFLNEQDCILFKLFWG